MLTESSLDVQSKALFLFYLLASRKSSTKIKESLLVKCQTSLRNVSSNCALKYVMQGNFSFDSSPDTSRGFLRLPSKNEGSQEEETESKSYRLSLHVWLSSLP